MNKPGPQPDDDATFDERIRAALVHGDASDRPPAAVRAAILRESRRVASEARQATGAAIEDVSPAIAQAEHPRAATSVEHRSKAPANDPRWRIPALASAAALAGLVAWPLLHGARTARPVHPAEIAAETTQHPLATDSIAGGNPGAAGPDLDKPPAVAAIRQAEVLPENAMKAPVPARIPAARPSAPVAAAEPVAAANSMPAMPSADSGVPSTAAPATREALSSSASVVGRAPAAKAAISGLAPAAVLRAASSGDSATLGTLLSQGANANATDSAGRSALLLATIQGSAECVRLLLGAGADPNLAANSGDTPLAVAQRAQWDEGVRILLNGGASR